MIEFYKAITLTHHMFDVKDIEHYMVSDREEGSLHDKLHSIKADLGIQEMVYLSTCNRVLYIFYAEQELDLPYIRRFLKTVNPMLTHGQLEKALEKVGVYEGTEAIRHVFEVASSIDSLVIGEREIFRQCRQAFEQSFEFGLAGDHMRILERSIINIAKKVYSNTRIGEKPLSVAALAMDLVLASENNPDSRVIFVGAGQTNQLMAKFFLKHHFKKFTVFNRSKEGALKLAESISGQANGLEALPNLEGEFDIAVIATSSLQPLFTAEMVGSNLASGGKTKTIIDLSVPRNVTPEVETMSNVTFISIDELRGLAEKNLDFRKQEVSIAKVIIQKSLKEFYKTYQNRQIEVALNGLPEEVRKVKENTISKVYKDKIAALDPVAQQTLMEVMDYFEKKYVSIPMKLAKGVV